MPWTWWASVPGFMLIFHIVTDLNSFLRARLNIEKWLFLCTSVYRKPMQEPNLVAGLTNFPFEFLCFTQDSSLPIIDLYHDAQKSQKWLKSQIKGGDTVLAIVSFTADPIRWNSQTRFIHVLDLSDFPVQRTWHYFLYFLLFLPSCRLESPAYYYAFLTPLCAILLANMIILLLCMYKLHKTLAKSREYSLDENRSGTTTKAALSLTVLLGVTWLVGIPMMDDATLVFQYIFAILNTIQGFAIFLFQVASKQDVRKKVVDTLHLRILGANGTSTLPSSRGGTLLSTLKSTFPKMKGSKKSGKDPAKPVPMTLVSSDNNWLLSSQTSNPTNLSPESEFTSGKSFGTDDGMLY